METLMDMDTAATFLAGSILFGLALIALSIAFIVINNLFSKYWKPVTWSNFLPEIPDSVKHPVAFMQDHPDTKEDAKGKK